MSVGELLDNLKASLGDWLGVDGHIHTVDELLEAVEHERKYNREAGRQEELERLAETQMLAHEWMRRHDGLLAWIQDNPSRLTDFVMSGPRPPSPSPADLPNAIAVAGEAGRQEERERCAAYVRHQIEMCDLIPGTKSILGHVLDHIEAGTEPGRQEERERVIGARLVARWCPHCGCGNDALGYAHAPLCPGTETGTTGGGFCGMERDMFKRDQ